MNVILIGANRKEQQKGIYGLRASMGRVVWLVIWTLKIEYWRLVMIYSLYYRRKREKI